MTLLCDTTQKCDFALPIATRAYKNFLDRSVDTIRHHMAEIIPMIRHAARASRPGLAVGILRLLCNDRWTAKRLYVDNEEPTCRVGCLDEPDLSFPLQQCLHISNIFVAFWRIAGIHLRGDRFFHDLITQTLRRSFQYGIVVMGIINAFCVPPQLPPSQKGQSREI